MTAACLKAAREAGLSTVLNPSPLPVEPLDLAAVSLLIVNRPEAEALTGEADAERAARQLRATGAENVIVTLGSAGAFVRQASASGLRIPAGDVEAVDASGAGDCFAGGYIAALQRGESHERAAQVANAVGALSVQKLGGTSGLMNWEDTVKWIERQVNADSY